MKTTLLFFYPPSVSKSLLIVLGTLPVLKHGAHALRVAKATCARYLCACFPLFCKFYRMPVCPCQGSWHGTWLHRLCVTCPISDCLAWRRSLDNSCPPRSCRMLSGKEKNKFIYVMITGKFSARQCSGVRSGERSICAVTQLVIECAP